MSQETKNIGLKTYEFNKDSTQDFVNGVAGHTGSMDSNMHKIDEVINNSTTDFQNKEHGTLSDRLTEDFGVVYNEISQMSLVGFEGESALKGSGKGITRDMTVKGNTFQNLAVGMGSGWYTNGTTAHRTFSSKLIKQGSVYSVIYFGDLSRVKSSTVTQQNTVTNNNGSVGSTTIDGGKNLIVKITPPVVAHNGTSDEIKYIPHIYTIDSTAWTPDELNKIQYIVLEGDWTNKPIPQYFEGVQSVGEANNTIEVKSVGKNLFDINGKYLVQQTTCSVKNDVLNVKGSWYTRQELNLKKNTKYTFSMKSKIISGTISNSHIYTNDTTQHIATLNVNGTVTITTPDRTDISILFYSGRGEVGEVDFWDIQIEESTTPTPYTPYTEDRKKLTLDAPLRSLPNGVKDEIVGNKLIRRVGKVVLDGSEAWKGSQYNTDTRAWYNLRNVVKFNKTHTNFPFLIVDTLPTYPNRNLYNSDLTGLVFEFLPSIDNSYDIQIRIEKTKLTSLDANGIKQWLQANPTTVYYELETPIETTLPKDFNVKTYPEVTHITNSNNPIKADLTYKAPVDLPVVLKDLMDKNEELRIKNNILTNRLETEVAQMKSDVDAINTLSVKLGLL